MTSQEAYNVNEEVAYCSDELEVEDVEDILEKLHIGTLRRDQLKVAIYYIRLFLSCFIR